MRRAVGRRGLTRALRNAGATLAPKPGFIDPCLATPSDGVPDRGEWIHEIKHDGYRAQAHLSDGRAVIYTRRGYDWSDTFSSIASAVRELPAQEAILDGEVVVLDERGVSDYRKLQEALAQRRAERFTYFVFDVLYLEGFDLRKVPLIERKRLLTELLAGVSSNDRVRLSEHIEADPRALIQHACAMQLEGIISKERDSPYRSGRQESWLKIKCNKSDTYPIIAFVEKLGAKPRRIASLYLGRWEDGKLLYAGKAQSGFKHQALYELRERLDPYIRKTSPLSVPIKKPKATWVEPVVQAEIEYSSLTADKLLRAPVYKGIRDDLLDREPPARATRSTHAAPRVPKENILQLLPDAVVPTREQLAAYWRKVASHALKYLARRPLKLVRHTRDTTFYHMGPLPPIPAAVGQLKVQKRQGGEGTRLWVENLEGFLGLVEIGVVEVHPWNSQVDDLEHADGMVFDLDPGPGIEWNFVVESAMELRELLTREKLDSWPKLTGGKGVHVMVPIASSRMTHDEAHRYSREFAVKLANKNLSRYTTSANLRERKGRLFIDYLRNGRGTTAVGAYSPRARPGLPIAAPVTWPEIENGVLPNAFTMDQPFRRARSQRARASSKRNRARDEELQDVTPLPAVPPSAGKARDSSRK